MSVAAAISENLKQLHARIEQAARRCGRDPSEIRLIAVTKYFDTALTRLVAESGCLDLGESRPQQLIAKAQELSDLPIRWHMIGHLQRNKVRSLLPFVSVIHSVDRLSLISAIGQHADASQPTRPIDLLIEVNISGEPQKHGFAPTELNTAIAQTLSCQHVRVGGLMAMTGRHADTTEARGQFAALRRLRDHSVTQGTHPLALHELSMGMSRDFEVAIEEGATSVRIGSLLMEGIETPS